MRCLLCQSGNNHPFEQTRSFGILLEYYQCEACGLIFQLPGEGSASDPDFYAETYRKVYQDTDEPTKKDLWVQQQRALILSETVQALAFGSPVRHLDIGASAGLLLKTFKQAFDCESVGIEPGNAYRAYAELQGLRMFPSLESLVEVNRQPFDLVSMIHVLEHLDEPLETLSLIRDKILLKDGILLLEVPNFYYHDSYELAHLVCYTSHTLREMVTQAGFQVVFINTHGLPRSSLLNLYITCLAQPILKENEPGLVKPDRFVKQKRMFGLFHRKVVQKIAPHRAWLPLPNEPDIKP